LNVGRFALRAVNSHIVPHDQFFKFIAALQTDIFKHRHNQTPQSNNTRAEPTAAPKIVAVLVSQISGQVEPSCP